MQKESYNGWDFVDNIATISESKNGRFITELNRVSKIGSKDCLDWRRWDTETNTPLKGATFSFEIAQTLNDALTKCLNR